MEPSRRNQRQITRRPKPRKQAKFIAVGCDQLPGSTNGKRRPPLREGGGRFPLDEGARRRRRSPRGRSRHRRRADEWNAFRWLIRLLSKVLRLVGPPIARGRPDPYYFSSLVNAPLSSRVDASLDAYTRIAWQMILSRAPTSRELRFALRIGGDQPTMTLERINPEDLPTPQTYTHVIVASGSRLVFVAGQVAEDGRGKLVGPGDLAAQARQTFANVGRALAAAGARTDQVTKITIFVVHYRDDYLPAIEDGRSALFGDHKPADTLIGVESLAHPGCLIEVEAIAVLDS
jgi:enamine deaminase RidA (YjgF/YER057c/UK114 family)